MVYTFNLENKVVLVTGGYGHLGRAVVESLVYHKAKVYVLGRDETKFSNSFAQNEHIGKTLFFQPCDIADSAKISAAFQQIQQANGKIDVLVNNAMYSKGQSPETMTDEEWATGVDGVLGSVFKATREIIPYFKQQGGGKIINVSSMYGMVAPDFSVYDESPAFLNPPHYGAAKAGVLQLTRYYASFLGKYGITVNAVTPGPFPSDGVQNDQGFVSRLAAKNPLGRIGKPEDLAGAFVFLASDTANYITGQNIVVDGGWTIR